MAKTKTRAVTAPVPQNRGEAASTVRRIGELDRELARREADMNDDLARIKEAVVSTAAPLVAERAGLVAGLQTWCEANRSVLTGGNKVKFADLGTGKIEWRTRPASVKGVPKDQAGMVARIKALGFLQFIRTKEEVDKEAMRADPDTARKVTGISVGSAGEDFAVEPFQVELQGAA